MDSGIGKSIEHAHTNTHCIVSEKIKIKFNQTKAMEKYEQFRLNAINQQSYPTAFNNMNNICHVLRETSKKTKRLALTDEKNYIFDL